MDVADPDCVTADGSEGVPVTGCANGTDDDSDGWTDAEDPDCGSGDSEVGPGTTSCNDDDDDDGDGATDRADSDCDTATDAETTPPPFGGR